MARPPPPARQTDYVADALTIVARLRNEISGPARAARASIRELGDEVGKANVKDKAAAAASRELADAHRKGEQAVQGLHQRVLGMSSTVGGAFVTGLKAAAVGVGGLAAAAGIFGLKAASNFQMTRVAFDTMLGSVEAGGKLFGQLQALNLKSPFELGQITQATQVLLRYGVAADTVVGITQGLANVAALSGPRMVENLDRMSLALGQVAAKGKLQGEEARQLAEAGVNAYGIYERKLGKTRAEVEALGEAGKLPANIILEAIAAGDVGIQGLNQAAEKMAGTLGGQLSNVKDILNVGLAEAAQPLVGQLQKLIGTPDAPGALVGGLQTLVKTLGPPVFTLIGQIAELATKALPVLGPVLDALVAGTGRLLTAMAPGFDALAPVAGELADSLVVLVDALVPVMPDLVTAFVGMVRVLPEFVRLLADLVPLVTPILTLINGLLGLEPVRHGLAVVLTALLAYRAVSGIAELIGGIAAAKRGLAAATDLETAANGRAAGFNAALGVGLLGGAVLLDANRRKVSPGSVIEGAAGGAMIGGAIGSVVPGVGTVVGAGVGALVGGVGTWALGAGRADAARRKAAQGVAVAGANGDTPSPRRSTVAAHLAADRAAPGQRYVTNAMFGAYSDSDHVAGRALDLVGSGLLEYARVVRASGGYADMHGDHLHAVYGDTPSPRRTLGGRAGEGVTIVDIHDNTFAADVDVERAVAAGIARDRRDRKERD